MDKIQEKRGLWDNIHSKRERIKRGSGERMRKPGEKGAPTAAALKASQVKEDAEAHSTDKNKPSSRFDASDELVNVYKKDTPGQSKTLSTVKKVVREALGDDCECGGNCKCNDKKKVNEAEYQGRQVPLNKTMKGDVKKSKVYVRNEKGNVVKVNFGDKNLSIKKNIPARKRSYCARSGGQGNLTKKTSANYWSRRAWKC
jgi:hypothetical protein